VPGRPALSQNFALSPDDKTAYFFAGPASSLGIVAVELGTGQIRSVVKLSGLVARGWHGLAVSRDGRTLALLLLTMSGTGLMPQVLPARIATVNTDGSGYREIYGPFNADFRSGPKLSWIGDRIIFGVITGNRERVMRIAAPGSQPEFTGFDVEARTDFRVNSDGSRVAFGFSRAGTDTELRALDVSALLKK
jgi:hypothetical protein